MAPFHERSTLSPTHPIPKIRVVQRKTGQVECTRRHSWLGLPGFAGKGPRRLDVSVSGFLPPLAPSMVKDAMSVWRTKRTERRDDATSSGEVVLQCNFQSDHLALSLAT